MPDTVRVHGEIKCPTCGTPVLNSARFQWGIVPGLTREVGDSVQWLRDSGGQIAHPFRLQSVGQGRWQWNCGSPEYRNVILFDLDVFTGNHVLECPKCGTKIAALIAIVRSDKFTEIRALLAPEVHQLLGASFGKADIVIVRDDGTYWPRDDWHDHRVEYVTV